MRTEEAVVVDENNYPHVGIVGGGIGGVALAVACLHRGIPFSLFERDDAFDERSQGYGLTLQQASKAVHGLGVESLVDGLVSTRHVVHSVDGKILGEWGMRSLGEAGAALQPKRTNIHIARQSLRMALLEQLGDSDDIHWGHRLQGVVAADGGGYDLEFMVAGASQSRHVDLLVGADGIRSAVRSIALGDDSAPLRYLGCLVVLGICPLSALPELESPLLDSATVFQTANGNERIYMMPFDAETVMWQLSFPMDEEEAKSLSAQGAEALKQEALKRCQWHEPIPQILAATSRDLISGYPVYDRETLQPEAFDGLAELTLIGDAAHPMSPFKGQGANQALLDALALARAIHKNCGAYSNWKERGLRDSVLAGFEAEMLKRSAVKVKDSADAAEFLHSEVALYEANEPRGRCLKKD